MSQRGLLQHPLGHARSGRSAYVWKAENHGRGLGIPLTVTLGESHSAAILSHHFKLFISASWHSPGHPEDRHCLEAFLEYSSQSYSCRQGAPNNPAINHIPSRALAIPHVVLPPQQH